LQKLKAFLQISHLIKKRVEANAPVDESGKPKGINPRTGEPYDHIKNSVVGRAYSKQRPDEPAAYTAIDYKKAPHAHFPEFGTVERVKKTGATTGHMPATPYFRPAVDQNRSKFFNEITKTYYGFFSITPETTDPIERGDLHIIHGTTTEVVKKVKEFIDLGVEHIMMKFIDFPSTVGLDLFLSEVYPNL